MSDIYNLADTWTSTATVYNAFQMNISNGSSGTPSYADGSMFINFKSNGTPKLQGTPTGQYRAASVAGSPQYAFIGNTGSGLEDDTSNNVYLWANGARILKASNLGGVTALSASLGSTDVTTEPSTTTHLVVGAGSTLKSQIRLSSGAAPASPANGDLWFDGSNLKIRIGGATFSVVRSTPEHHGARKKYEPGTLPVHNDTLMQIRRRQIAAALGGSPFSWALSSGGTLATLDVDFVNDRAKNGLSLVSIASLLTCSRATPADATYTNAAGVISYFAADTLRYGDNGLLVEESRANLALQASDFTNASWTKSNMTTAKTATGPDGVVNSASTLTATNSNATALQAITSGSAARITSVYIKRRTGTGNIDLTQDNGSTWATKVVTSSWTRYEIAPVTSTNPTVGIRIVTNGDAVDVFLFQHELGAFITSPIPTTTGSVTRAGDVIAFSTFDWYTEPQGTFYSDCLTNSGGTDARIIGSEAGRTAINLNFSDTQLITFDIGTLLAATVGGGATIFARTKAAVSADGAGASLCAGAGTVATNVDAVGFDMTTPNLGQANGSSPTGSSRLYRRVAFWQTRISDAGLQALTA